MKWAEVKDTDGKYLISDDGRVFSVLSERMLTLQSNSEGYKRVELVRNGTSRRYLVHRLVAEAFIPNPNNYPLVNHKDEDKTNNHVENLEWCDGSYNVTYGTAVQRRVANTDYKYGADNPASKTVYQFDMSGNLIGTYSSTYEASRKTGLNA